MRIRRALPRPATVIATVALIAALGGSAYAASKIGSNDIEKNAVKARHIDNGTLKGRDHAKEALKSSHIKDGTLRGVDLTEEFVESLRPRWLLLNENGEIEEQSGGFTVIDAYATNDNVYVDAGESMEGHGIQATVALQNKLEIDAAPGADPSFDGQVSVARCQTAAVECAPAGAKTENAFVVSPRRDDGSATGPNNRERVYVTITP